MKHDHRREIAGIDVGGANLKYASTCGHAWSRSFPMWKHPDRLRDVLVEDLSAEFRHCPVWAVTMTGELADCFADRKEGVHHIIDQVESASRVVGITEVYVYGVNGRFRRAGQARKEVDQVAAANWHALASYAAEQFASSVNAILVDVGSTTTDVIPVARGQVSTAAQTDFERLSEGSLLYLGCQRTPVCGLVDRLGFRGKLVDVMNEWFATIDDARLLLGFEKENADDHESADGKPRTIECAANRLARMIGLDRRDVSVSEAKQLAMQVHAAAKRRIESCLSRLAGNATLMIISGHGDDLVDCSPYTNVIRLRDRIGETASRSAASYAVAQLLQSNLSDPSHVPCAG